MRTETIFQMMRDIIREGGDFRTMFTNQILGMTVLTDYNNKTYQITDINFDMTPSSTFETKNGTISFMEYYRTKYNINIRDPNQPMLLSKAKEKSIRGGQNELIALVPELCRATGMSDAMRTNFK